MCVDAVLRLGLAGFMGRHKDCPAGVIIEGNLLDQGQDDLTDEEYAERKPQAVCCHATSSITTATALLVPLLCSVTPMAL